jgi:response regulator RpfG family c-di-GMP phosphodiesterase
MKILLIEDEPFMLEAISNVLENSGKQVFKVNNVADAKKLLETEIFSLILTDLYFPEPAGFDLVNYAKSNPRTSSVPVIVITGMVNHPEIMSEKIPADEWLIKPFTLLELQAVVKKYLEIEV